MKPTTNEETSAETTVSQAVETLAASARALEISDRDSAEEGYALLYHLRDLRLGVDLALSVTRLKVDRWERHLEKLKEQEEAFRRMDRKVEAEIKEMDEAQRREE